MVNGPFLPRDVGYVLNDEESICRVLLMAWRGVGDFMNFSGEE